MFCVPVQGIGRLKSGVREYSISVEQPGMIPSSLASEVGAMPVRTGAAGPSAFSMLQEICLGAVVPSFQTMLTGSLSAASAVYFPTAVPTFPVSV